MVASKALDALAEARLAPPTMLDALGLALADAAREGRNVVVGELAAIVARVSSEARRIEHERHGVAELEAGRGRV